MTLYVAAKDCLTASACEDKIARTFDAAAAFARGDLMIDADAPPPDAIDMPGRPAKPLLVHPRDLSKRGLGSESGRAAFIHAIAHIEFNAIDLAWDAVYRFRGMPERYYADWVRIAYDEARHFVMLRERLRQLNYDYGDFDAHNGLWEMAEKTAHDVTTRMALVPRVLEARGLDVTPAMIVKLRALGDRATVEILEVILEEEIAHVAAGSTWFRWCCEQERIEPRARFKELLREYAYDALRPPFNVDARRHAGFDEDELEALTAMTID